MARMSRTMRTMSWILCGCFWFVVFALDIHNYESLTMKNVGESFALGLTLTEEEQSMYLSSTSSFELPGLCLMINGCSCDCYEGRITDIKSMPLFGCPIVIDSFRQRQDNSDFMVNGFYFSVVIFDGRNSQISSTPVFIPLLKQYSLMSTVLSSDVSFRDKLTLVLPLTLNDLSRVSLLMTSLRTAPFETIAELIVLTPSNHKELICGALQGMRVAIGINFPLRCLSESILLPNTSSHYNAYAIQMALKLLVARIVQTDFYMTLDADLICLHPSMFANIFSGTKGSRRAVYHFENIEVHQSWWESSARILNISHNSLIEWAMQNENSWLERANVGIGVTPAVLSTFGSLLTVWEIIRQFFCASYAYDHSNCFKLLLKPGSVPKIDFSNGKSFDQFSQNVFSPFTDYEDGVHRWISSLGYPPDGYIWSEYTLYRLTLAKYKVFHRLHVSESMSDLPIFLHCNNVWFVEQWPWDAASAYQNTSCLFSVIQSTANIPPGTILPYMTI